MLTHNKKYSITNDTEISDAEHQRPHYFSDSCFDRKWPLKYVGAHI